MTTTKTEIQNGSRDPGLVKMHLTTTLPVYIAKMSFRSVSPPGVLRPVTQEEEVGGSSSLGIIQASSSLPTRLLFIIRFTVTRRW